MAIIIPPVRGEREGSVSSALLSNGYRSGVGRQRRLPGSVPATEPPISDNRTDAPGKKIKSCKYLKLLNTIIVFMRGFAIIFNKKKIFKILNMMTLF